MATKLGLWLGAVGALVVEAGMDCVQCTGGWQDLPRSFPISPIVRGKIRN